MKTRIIILIAGICLLSFSSCLREILCIEGDNNVVTETRRSSSFHELENSTSFDVIYKEADTLGITIIAEQNILNYIETNVYDGCLEISVSTGSICLDYNERPLITATAPRLDKVVSSGSGSMIADRMKGETVTVKNSGSGDISVSVAESTEFKTVLSGSGDIDVETVICINADISISGSGNTSVSGECETAHLKITGSGNIYGREMEAVTASVILSGSGSAYANIEEHLNGLISGSGNIYVRGDPVIEQTLTGSGRIIKIN